MDQDATWYGGRPRPTRHFVRCGPSYPQKKGYTHSHPIFGPCPLWPNGWMDEDAAWYGSRPRLRLHCTRRGPSSSERAQHPPAPSFLPVSIVAMFAHLSYCRALVEFCCIVSFSLTTKLPPVAPSCLPCNDRTPPATPTYYRSVSRHAQNPPSQPLLGRPYKACTPVTDNLLPLI